MLAKRFPFFLMLVASAAACSGSHERDGGADATPAASAVEIGTGCTEFEALPREGGTVLVTPHVRGGYGVCAPVRVRGAMEGAPVGCEALDPATGDVVARPRADEMHTGLAPDGDWLVSTGVMLLFESPLMPADLAGRALLLRATATAADGSERVDERMVTVSAGECDAWSEEILSEWRAIRACTDASECGQDIPIACGCTRNPVARLDADITRFMDLLMTRPTGPDGVSCENPGDIPYGSTCDCPPADGYLCDAGVCQWNLLSP